MENLKKAKEILLNNDCSFVLVKGNKIKTSNNRGIQPIYNALIEYPELMQNACIADKVIGKAASMIAVHAGVKAIFTKLTTYAAVEILKSNNIKIEYEHVVEAIKNREKTGLCPMEALSKGVEETSEMVIKVKDFLEKIKNPIFK